MADVIIDLDGDGRDELLVWYDRRRAAWGRDLKEIWSRPAQSWSIGPFLPSTPGRPRTLIIEPMTGLDGSTGRVLWTYKAPPWEDATLLDPGDSGRMPRVVSAGLYSGRTVCRQVLPATPGGDCQRPSGSLVPAGHVPDDPRWTRPLPWTGPVRRVTAPSWVFALVGLALVNVVLPIAMLRLAAGRRPWTLRLLMMLPMAAAVPLCAYLAVEPLMPAQVEPAAAVSQAVVRPGHDRRHPCRDLAGFGRDEPDPPPLEDPGGARGPDAPGFRHHRRCLAAVR